jgi:hypothetical protein
MKRQITKSYLEYLGITDVTEDGRVFTKNGELKPHRCCRSKNNPANQEKLKIQLHDPDKYKSTPKAKRNSNSGRISIRLHHVVYAWFKGEIPYGKELHHIDHNYLNNSINNLEALTHEEHLAKHDKGNKELKCRLDIPREWYVKKLEDLQAIENKTMVDYVYISQYKAKIRYYDSHIEEVIKLTEFKKDLLELAYWKKVFKDEGNKRLWHECCTIEKMVKTKGTDAWVAVKHALEVIHEHFGRN